MRIYVVMPHYIITKEVAELAKNAIKSFKNTCDCTVISCDDCSPYEDVGFLKEMSDVYIRNEKNLGFAANCNVGFRWIFENEKDDCYIVCANNDIEVFEYWFDELKKALDMFQGSMSGGLGYKDRIVEGMRIEDYRINPGSKFTARYMSIGGRLQDWMFPGGMWMSTKGFLDKMSEIRDGKKEVFDSNFQHGGYEDVDLFLRAIRGGHRLAITPRMQYWHKEGATRFSEQELGTQNIAEKHNLEYFLKKNNFNPHQNILDFMKDEVINY
jgi:GT2 family glycosyltransferase